jgi:hypothetical protein
MPQPNKIITYGLEERVLELSALPGMTDIRIADVLNQELAAKDLSGTVSASAVSRFRRAARSERAAETKALIQDHIKGVVPKDLEALEEVESWLLSIFRNQGEILQVKNPDLLQDPEVKRLMAAVSASEYPAGFDVRTRSQAAMMALKVIELKLKYSGALDDPNREAAEVKKVQELLDDFDDELKGKAQRAFGSGRQKEGVPGPH